MLKSLSIIALALSLGACALFGPPSQTRLQTTATLVSVWTDFAQPTIDTYGSWPDCDPARPNLKLCRDHAFWVGKLQPAAWAAHTAIQAATPVLLGEVPDVGQLQAALDAINAAETAFKSNVAVMVAAPVLTSAPH